MDVDQGDFEFLRASVLRASADLRQSLATVDVQPPVRGAYVLQHARDALAEVELTVARFEELAHAPHATGHAHLTGGMRLLGDQVRAVHAAVPWIETLHRRSLPLGLIYFVEEAALALGVDIDVLLNPDPIYMYSTDVEPFRSWVGTPPKPQPRPVIISFPVREAPSLFLNAIFVHELAHVAVEEGLVDRVVDAHAGTLLHTGNKPYAEAINRYVENQLATFTGGIADEATARAQLAADAADILRTLLDGWLEETLCDALAFAYLGPSYLFACADFLYSASSMEGSARAHPPEALRLKILFAAPAEPQWRALVTFRAKKTLGWLEAISKGSWEGDPFEQFAGGFIHRAADTIHSVASEHLGQHVFAPSAFECVEEELLQLLHHGVLPVQLDHTLPVAAPPIILAGWLHQFSTAGDTPATVATALANRQLQAFLTKAIEMSTLASRWEATEGQSASSS